MTSIGVALLLSDTLTLHVTESLLFRINRTMLQAVYLRPDAAAVAAGQPPQVPLPVPPRWIGVAVASGWRQFAGGRPFKLVEFEHTNADANQANQPKVHFSSLHALGEFHDHLAGFGSHRAPSVPVPGAASSTLARGQLENADADSIMELHEMPVPHGAHRTRANYMFGSWKLAHAEIDSPLLLQEAWSLSDTMALSAAAVAGNMARYAAGGPRSLARQAQSSLFHIGVNMGAFVSLRHRLDNSCYSWTAWFVGSLLVGVFLLAGGIVGLTSAGTVGGLEQARALEITGFVWLFVLLLVAFLSFLLRQPGRWWTWFLPPLGSSALRGAFRALDFDVVGDPPRQQLTHLFMSDGGHLENLALFPLVRRWWAARKTGDPTLCWSGEATLARDLTVVSIDGSQDTEVLTSRGGDLSYVIDTCRELLDGVTAHPGAEGTADVDAMYNRVRSDGNARSEPFRFYFRYVDNANVEFKLHVYYVKPSLKTHYGVAEIDKDAYGCCCHCCAPIWCFKWCCGSFPNDATGSEFYYAARARRYNLLGQSQGRDIVIVT